MACCDRWKWCYSLYECCYSTLVTSEGVNDFPVFPPFFFEVLKFHFPQSCLPFFLQARDEITMKDGGDEDSNVPSHMAARGERKKMGNRLDSLKTLLDVGKKYCFICYVMKGEKHGAKDCEVDLLGACTENGICHAYMLPSEVIGEHNYHAEKHSYREGCPFGDVWRALYIW